jgi:ABC-type glycerol-3-phosphate transport system permease component
MNENILIIPSAVPPKQTLPRLQTLWQEIVRGRWGYLFVSPFFILYTIFGLYPLLFSIWLSFNEWNGVRPMEWVGLENYQTVFRDRLFWQSMGNSAIIFVMHVPLMLFLALLLAVVLNTERVRGYRIYRTILFTPYITNMVAAGFVFQILLNNEYGVFNAFLGVFGVQPIPWLETVTGGRISLSILIIWAWLGYEIVIMMAGLQTIPKELNEAARIDGANAAQTFLYITIPLMRPILLFCFVLSTMGTFALFAEVDTLTRGGPMNATVTPIMVIFQQAFGNSRLGYAAAMSYSTSPSYLSSPCSRWCTLTAANGKERLFIMSKRLTSLLIDVGLQSVLIAASVFMLLPFAWMLATSLKPDNEIFTRPIIFISSNSNLNAYTTLIERYNIFRVVWQTFAIAGLSTAVSLFFCAMCGYGFAKFRFPGRNAMFTFLLGTMIIPFSITMVPLYIIMRDLRWIDTIWPLIIPGAANAFGTFFMRQYITAIPDELLDAARVDGASEPRIFGSIILPIIMPGLTSLGLIFFMGAWNGFLWPLVILKSPDNFTLPLVIRSMTGVLGRTSYNVQMAAAVVSIIPLLVIFLFFQRRFVDGITAGAVKS